MPATLRCPQCPVVLRVPEGAAGKSVRCPKCRTVIPVPAAAPATATAALPPEPAPVAAPRRIKPEFIDDEPASPLELADAPAPNPSSVATEDEAPTTTPKKRKKKKAKKKGPFDWLPNIAVEDSVKRMALGCLVVVGGIIGLVVGGYYAFRTPPPAEIAPSQWQTVEVPGVFRGKLPGEYERKTQAVAGISMIMYSCQPNSNCVYGIAYTTGPLPPHMKAMSTDELLEDSCDGSVAALKEAGGKEVKRERVSLGEHPGRQLIIKIPRASGKMISRIYYAHGRKFIVMGGGRGFEADQKNMEYLFENFEILEPDPAAAKPEPKPEPKPTPKPEPKPEPKPAPKPEPPKSETPLWAEDLDITLPRRSEIAGLEYTSDRRTLVVATRGGAAVWYDTDERKVIATRERTSVGEGLDGCAVSPDGNRVAFYRHGGLLLMLDRREPGETILDPVAGGGISFWKAVFSPDSKQLCTTHGSRMARIWDVEKRKLVKELTDHKGQVTSAAFSPDGSLLATADTDVRLWDTETFAHMATLKGAGQRTFTDMAFDPDLKRLAAANGPTVFIWNLGTDPDGGLTISEPRQEHHAHTVRAVRFAPDGRLVSLTDGGTLRVMDAETGKTLAERPISGPGGYTAAAMHPIEARLAVVQGNRIRVIDLDKFTAE